MDKLFILLKKKKIDEYDRQLASDYVSYYGIDPTEYNEYADEFVAVCYDYNEQTGEHEPTTPDKLPFATVERMNDRMIAYEYGNQRVIKLDGKNFFEKCLQNKKTVL